MRRISTRLALLGPILVVACGVGGKTDGELVGATASALLTPTMCENNGGHWCTCPSGKTACDALDDGCVSVCPVASDAGSSSDVGTIAPTPATLAWPSAPVVSAGNDMRLPGSGSVGADGQFHYTLPIDVPAGRLGMAPSLSLSYSSGNGNGPLGVGWSLSGLSSIGPCPEIQAIDGAAFPVNLDGRDRLCMDGQRLFDTSDGAGTSFNTEIEGYAKITTFTDPTTGSRAFHVQSQTGEIRTYKQYGTNPATGLGLYWLLDTVQDLEGNAISYAYNDLSATEEPSPSANVGAWEYSINTITYTNRVSASGTVNPGMRQVTFNYESRPDPLSMRYGASNPDPRLVPGSIDGTPVSPTQGRAMDVRTTMLLKGISVSGPVPTSASATAVTTGPVWSYSFGYAPSTKTGRSLLTSVNKTGAQGGQTLTRSFGYDSASGLDSTRWSSTPVPVAATGTPLLQALMAVPGTFANPMTAVTAKTAPVVLQADLLHDGRTLLLQDVGQGGPGGITVSALTSSGLQPVNITGLSTATLQNARIVDLDGDGIPEIVAPDVAHLIFPGTAYPGSSGGIAYGVYKLDPSTLAYAETTTTTWYLDYNEPFDGNGWFGTGLVSPYCEGTVLFQGTDLGSVECPPYGPTPPPAVSPIFFVDNTGTGLPSGIWAHHNPWPGGKGSPEQAMPNQSTPDIACQQPTGSEFSIFGLFSIAEPTTNWYQGCLAYTWGAVGTVASSPGLSLATATPWDGSAAQAFNGGARWESSMTWGVPLADPTPTEPVGILVPIPSKGGFGAMALTDGSGASIMFAGMNSADASIYIPAAAAGSTTPQPILTPPTVPYAAWTTRNLALWDVSHGAPTSAPSYHVSLDASDATSSHLWLEIDSDPYEVIGNFDGRSITESFDVAPWTLLPATDPNSKSNDYSRWQVRQMDYDQDGRSDVIAYHLAPASPQLYASNIAQPLAGIDAAYLFHWGVGGLQAPVALSIVPLAIGDFDGDGTTDLIGGTVAQLNSVGPYFYKGQNTAHDRLTLVSDQGAPGFTDSVSYAPQPSSASSTGACGAYPTECAPGGTTVVTQHQTYQGAEVNAYDIRNYRYGTARYNVLGRGFLGFDWVDEQAPNRPEETITYYANQSPIINGAYLGSRPTKVVHYVATAPIVGSSASASVRATTLTRQYRALVTTGASYTIQQPSWQSVEQEYTSQFGTSLNSALFYPPGSSATTIRTRSGSASFDAYGNVTNSGETTSGGVESSTQTTFYPPDTTHFLRSLPQTVQTSVWTPATNTAPSVRRIDYTYDTTGAGDSPVAPHPARVLTQTVNGMSADASIPATTTYMRSADGVVTGTTISTESAVTAGAASTGPSRTSTVMLDPNEGMFPRQVSDALGHTTQLLVNPIFGVAQDTIDPNNVTAQIVLDDFGRTRSSTSAAGTTVKTSFTQRLNTAGNIVGATVSVSGPGVTPSIALTDMMGRTVVTQHLDLSGAWDATATAYDVLGRVTTQTRPVALATAATAPFSNAASTSYAYDPLDRTVLTTMPDGSKVSQAQTFLTTTTTDAMNNVSEIIRDVDGRTTQSIQVAATGNATTTFQYGDFNEVTQVTDANGNVTATTYDLSGRKRQLVDPDAGTITWTYDGFGDVLSETHPSSNSSGTATTSYAYDPLGRVTVTTYSDGSHAINTYDTQQFGIGKLAQTMSQDCVTELIGYDIAGRASTTQWTVPTAATPTAPTAPATATGAWTCPGTAETFNEQVIYDAYGRPGTMYYPNDGTPYVFGIQNNYDAASGLLKTITETDNNATLWQVKQRNADGTLYLASDGNGAAYVRAYDVMGRPTGISDNGSAGSIVSLGYTYYADGTVHTRADGVANRTETYGYDSFHRVTSWTLADAGVSNLTQYGYDVLGNLLTVTTNGKLTEQDTYAHGGFKSLGSIWEFIPITQPHQLESQAFTPAAGAASTTTFGYDPAGRQTSSSNARSSVVYTDFDLPRSVADLFGNKTSFLYDASHARIKKTSPTTGITTVTLGGVFERRQYGTNTPTYVLYAPFTDGVMAQIDITNGARTFSYTHPDSLGTTVAVSSVTLSGATSQDFYYDPFGKRISAAGTVATGGSFDMQIGFTSQEMDDDLTLINMKGRIYDPIARHFLSIDPHVTFPLNAQSYNPYSYVMNDPVNVTDPSGFDDDGGEGEGSSSGSSSIDPGADVPSDSADVSCVSSVQQEATPDNGSTTSVPATSFSDFVNAANLDFGNMADPIAPTTGAQLTGAEQLQQAFASRNAFWGTSDPQFVYSTINDRWYRLAGAVSSEDTGGESDGPSTPAIPDDFRPWMLIDYSRTIPLEQTPPEGGILLAISNALPSAPDGRTVQIGVGATGAAPTPLGASVQGGLSGGITARAFEGGWVFGWYATASLGVSLLPGIGAGAGIAVTPTPSNVGGQANWGSVGIGPAGATVGFDTSWQATSFGVGYTRGGTGLGLSLGTSYTVATDSVLMGATAGRP